jgi:hypothetical protein
MTSAFLNICGVSSMSKNLRELLNYYGQYFKPQETVIHNRQIHNSSCLIDPMTVIDPHNHSNNVTRSAFRIRDIQEIFKRAYLFIVNNEELYKKSSAISSSTESSLTNFGSDIIQKLTAEDVGI